MWGTWWVWDARLTSVFVLFLMYLGLIALSRALEDPSKSAKSSAILVNTARGPVIDEEALHTALTTGVIRAAGLDVFDQEPPPTDNPLFDLDNVILTAHLAGPTFESNTARVRNAFDNVQRVARGEDPLWVIPELED